MYETDKALTEKMPDDDFLKKAVKDVEAWYTYYSEAIQRARNYLRFLYVDQWDPGMRSLREARGKATLQVNKLTTVVRSILGEQRENSPNLEVRPLTKKATQEDIDIRSGLLRQIEYASRADQAYQICFKSMLEVGWGALHIKTRYAGEDTFDQEIVIEKCMEIDRVYFDPCSKEPDKSDGNYCGTYITMSIEDFKRKYPDVENPQSVTVDSNYADFNWISKETVTMCLHYYKDWYKKTIVELTNGETMEWKEAKELMKTQKELLADNPDLELMGAEMLEIAQDADGNDKKRTEDCYKVKYKIFTKNEILEEGTSPFDYLPLVYGDGDSTIIDGQTIPVPFVQDAIDTQRLINYIASELATALLRSRKETFMATPAQVAGHEEVWRNPDNVQGALFYNPDPMAPGAPMPVTPPQVNAVFLQQKQDATSDLQQVTGMFEESRGEQSNAMSGIAIGKRQEASKKPVNVYYDNLARAIQQCGRIMLSGLSKVYDTEREVMIRQPDGRQDFKTVNQYDGTDYSQAGEGKDRLKNDIKLGKWDVEVSVDGSYAMQKAEALSTMIELAGLDPQRLVPILADLIAENTALENVQQIVERLQSAYIPPNVIAKEKGQPPPQAPPDPMMQMQQQKMQMDQQAMQLSKEKMQAELAREQMQTQQAKIKAETDIKVAQINLKGKMIDHHGKRVGHAGKVIDFQQKVNSGIFGLTKQGAK